jgi:hypothetical protein
MDAATVRRLENAFRRETRSFLQYVRDAFPWTTAGELATLAKLQGLIGEELEAAGTIAEFLARHRQGLPPVGTYPMNFTSLNFVSLDHLLPILLREERKSLADRERDFAEEQDSEAQTILRNIVNLKRRHLQTLEEMAAAHPDTLAPVRSSA